MFWMWFWFCLSILLLVVELLTADLICIWFGASALLVGILLAIFPALPIAWQFVIFVFASAGLLAVTRPLVKRFLHFNRAKDTNLDRLIGQVAVVTERIDNLNATGAVRIGGLVWTARSLDGDVIEVDSYVTFEKIEGNKALVKKKGE